MAAKTEGVITAVYKVNLHCRQCTSDIKKPLMRTQGVHGVEFDVGKGEIKVTGVIDVIKIHRMIEKVSNKKVEILSPQIKIPDKDKATTTPSKPKEIKKDLRNKLLKHKDIYSVKSDMKAQSLTVEGIMEPEKLLSYIKKKVHKHAEMISSKTMEAKEEKKEIVKVEAKKEEVKVVGESSENKIVKSTDASAPYFVHYVYAPQLFSDENPNACTII